MAPRLLCLGNLTIDTIVRPDGTEQPDCIGGDAFYGTLGARIFEPSAEMLAPIGNDLPAATRDFIERHALAGSALPERNRPTLTSRVVYRAGYDDRHWTFYYDEADFFDLSPRPEDIPPRLQGTEAVLILAMSLKAQEDLVPFLRRTGTDLIALDPQQDYITGNERRLHDVVRGLDVFTPSAIEVERLLGTQDWPDAARQFAELGPRLVVIKLGGDGCLVHDAATGRHIRVPAAAGIPIDTTGAGDSFCGGFMARLVQDRSDLEGAAQAGAIAAAATISDFGAAGIMQANPTTLHAQWRHIRQNRADSGLGSAALRLGDKPA